jgi:hypothetical protein
MGRKRTIIKQSVVARATRGLLIGAAAAGVTGDIELDLEAAVIRLHIRGDSGAAVAAAETDVNEWNSVL